MRRETEINQALPLRQAAIGKRQPRARGAVRLSTKPGARGSVLDDLRLSGSLKFVFPRPAGTAVDAVIVNTAGGITGGDRFDVEASVGPDTALTLTTQAAERAYRAQAGEVGHLTTRLSVASQARLHWLPQETILFDGSSFQRSLCIELHETASLLMVEPLVFGRLAMEEVLGQAHFRDRIEISRAGRLLFTDQMTLSGDVHAHLARPHVANGAGAMALVVLVDPGAEAALPKVRSLLPETAGASLIGEDVLVIRALAADSYDLRTTLVPLLQLLSKTDLPKCWMI